MPRPQDHYGKKAKELGYPARSVFKLKEIMEKFPIIPKSPRILDIGAAPGSFSLFFLQQLKGKGSVVAVDLAERISIPGSFTNFQYIRGDIFAQDIQDRIFTYGPFDVIISDAAPSTTGQKEVDALKSISIAECVLGIAKRILRKDGNLVVKIFQGGGESEFFNSLRASFQNVKGFKPQASRRESFETYFIGIGFNP